jgi:hypothetical protein
MAVLLPSPRRREYETVAGGLDLDAAVKYYNRVIFFFVPNVCNARCEFCYVAPRFTESARLPDAMLTRASQVAVALKSWGFDEVRITGGEPLVFDNYTELVRRVTDAGLKYRLLTNGINLGANVDFALAHPPVQITVSVHDPATLHETFGVPVDGAEIIDSISRLSARIPVECTIVLEGAERGSIDATLVRLASAGVARVKLLLANVPGSADGRETFRSIAQRAQAKHGHLFRSLRFSATEPRPCGLARKGFLSLDLPSMRIYSCCVQLGEPASVVGAHSGSFRSAADAAFDPTQAQAEIVRMAEVALAVTDYPCTAHYCACPISLEG